jgi:hypothetical protein
MADEIISPAEGARDDQLKAAAVEIHAGLELWQQGQRACAEGMLRAAAALAKAKKLLSSTKEFSAWCQANGYGQHTLDAHDRAALIIFGSNLDKARRVLSGTDRKSPRHILANEWEDGDGTSRHGHVTKSTASRTSPRKKSVPHYPVDEIADLMQAIVRRFAGGLTFTARQIADRLSAPFSNVTKALERLGPQASRLANDTYRISDSRELTVIDDQAAAAELAAEASMGPVLDSSEPAESHHGYDIEDHTAALRKPLETERQAFQTALAAKDREIDDLRWQLAAKGREIEDLKQQFGEDQQKRLLKALDEAHATINQQQEEIERLRAKVPKGREKGDQPWFKVGVHRGTWWKWSDEKRSAALAKLEQESGSEEKPERPRKSAD